MAVGFCRSTTICGRTSQATSERTKDADRAPRFSKCTSSWPSRTLWRWPRCLTPNRHWCVGTPRWETSLRSSETTRPATYAERACLVHIKLDECGSVFIRLAVVASQKCEAAQNSENMWTYSSSRSSKVIDLGANRKRICDFLLVISSNLVVSRTVFEMSTHKARNSLFSPPHSCLTPRWTSQNFWIKIIPQKLQGLGYCAAKVAWS